MIATPQLAVSTWSVHRTIGVGYFESPANPGPAARDEKWGTGQIPLVEVPARLKTLGIDRIEICHFHIDRHDRGFLDDLRAAIDDAGATLQTLLIDDGDITDPANHMRDRDWIASWIETAAYLGAEKARVICGKQAPSADVLDRAVDGLAALASHGETTGIRVLTENWLATTPGPREVNAVLDRLDGRVGLLADTGNWSGPGKYDDLAEIFGRAENAHTKAYFYDGMMIDAGDYGRCLDVAKECGYAGPHTLIYDGADANEWRGLEIERDFVIDRLMKGTLTT